MWNGLGFAVVAVLGMANGLHTDGGVSIWRVFAYPVIAGVAYLLGRHLAHRHGGWILLAVAALTLPAAPLVSDAPVPLVFWESVSAGMSLAMVVALPWLIGRSRRQQAELVQAGRREVEQLKRERAHLSERAGARERARIATDVHDSLGHDLALIALRAGALELSPGLTADVRRAAEELRDSAVKATDRLRETIGMLREDAVPVAPHDDSVAELVEQARAAGMDVRLAAEDLQLAPLVDRAVHRVVREALTNAARHAPGARTTVHIGRVGAVLSVEVSSTGGTAAPTGTGSGSGLLELDERVRLLGGEFSARPHGDGFTVTARLPQEPPRSDRHLDEHVPFGGEAS